MKNLAYFYRSLVMSEVILMHDQTFTPACQDLADQTRIHEARDLAYSLMSELKRGSCSSVMSEFFDHKDAKELISQIRTSVDNLKKYPKDTFGVLSATSHHKTWKGMCNEIVSYPDQPTNQATSRALGGGTVIHINTYERDNYEMYAVYHSDDVSRLKVLIDSCNDSSDEVRLHHTLQFAMQMGVSIIQLDASGKAYEVEPFLDSDNFLDYKRI